MSHNHEDYHSHGYHHVDLTGRDLFITILLNILITVSQIIGAFISGSLSLMSDAMHNLSDVTALIISYIAQKLSLEKQNEKYTFGYKRAEIMAAFINATTLIAIAVLLIKEAIERLLIDDGLIIKGGWVIGLALFSIIANGLSVIILHKHAKDNINIKSAYLHLFSDMLSSIAVLIGGLFMFYLKIYWIDSVLTILIGVYLLFSSWGIFIDSLKILMQFTPKGIDIDKIKTIIEELPEVDNIHHVHVWKLNDKQIHFEAHVDLCRDMVISKTGSIHMQIGNLLKSKYHIEHITIQFEYNACKDKELIYNKE
ncbi:MAG: cation diffusion facilitator family transporter [Bacteroidota bacterium]